MSTSVFVQTAYSGNEVPTGLINGANKTFTLAYGIVNPATFTLSRNGVNLAPGDDYTLSGLTNQTLTVTVAPKAGDTFIAFYQYGTVLVGGYINTVVEGTQNGLNRSFTLVTAPAPAESLKLYFNGLLLVPGVDYNLVSNNLTLTFAPSRTDILLASYRGAGGGFSWPVYHNPVFPQASYTQNANSLAIYPSINISTITGDSIYFQVEAEDYEGDTLIYSLGNANSVPGNITINSSNGWLSGPIIRELCLAAPYTVYVTATKAIDALATTTIPVTFSVQNGAQQNLVWTSSANLGAINPGVPCSLSIAAEVIQPFTAQPIRPAVANCTMQLIAADIVNGGNLFVPGDSFTVPGGVYTAAPAQLTVSAVTGNGTISAVAINVGGDYTELPNPLTVVWENPHQSSGDVLAYNAEFNLNFGVSAVDIVDGGSFYDTVNVGFGEAGEVTRAAATATVHNGIINSVTVTNPGSYYPAVPTVAIRGTNTVSPTNPISYRLLSGQLPTGLTLMSNGMLAGIPSTQYFSLDSGTVFDQNRTTFDNVYEFTVQANVSTNDIVEYLEQGIGEPFNSDNYNTEEIPTLVQSEQTFSLTLNTNVNDNFSTAPKTNLSLEFLLSDADLAALYTPLRDESIVPNSALFRPGDFYFGIAPHVRMLMAYGISALLPSNIIAAMSKYHQNKTFLLNNLKWAQSTTEGYEVIYIEPVDQYTNTNSGQALTGSIVPAGNMPVVLQASDSSTADSVILGAAQTTQYELFPASIPNMIRQLNDHLSAFDDSFLPSWMTDVQQDGSILGFVPAIPLVYVQPGEAERIAFYLQQYYNTTGPSLNSIEATTDRYIWNAGYAQNWNITPVVSVTGNNSVGILAGTASFTVNAAVPTSYTTNLTPRAWSYQGNVTISIPSFANTVPAIVDIINSLDLVAIEAAITANDNITIQNVTGCPFQLYDGNQSPLQSMGILPTGVANATITNSQPAGWLLSEITDFDVYGLGSTELTTETNSILLETEDNLLLYTEGTVATTFTDVPEFFEVSDSFLADDQGSIYLKFNSNSLVQQPIVTV